ncbi:MAG TPA: carbon storage regulator, partial [Myxococcaceae bacterium]|nr:carbon storage regulator [Myxococcaceae bacterium]
AIEPGIHLTVVAVEGRNVRLGLDAPESVTILRSELVDSSPHSRRCEEHRLGRSRCSPAALLRLRAC